MKKIVIIFSISLTLTLAGILYATRGHQEEEPKYQVVRLLVDEIQPSTATINPGAVVIWTNEVPGMVEIQFTNVNMATKKIPCAELEGICLIQKGEFDYVVSKGSSKLEGKIIVK